MVKVLFVCLGNICRSPLAQGLFEQAVKTYGLQAQISADSCGTSNYHIGSAPDRRTLDNARSNGLELIHKGRQFQIADFTQFDYIVAMDQENLAHIQRLQRENNLLFPNLYLMRHFDPSKDHDDVPDPYYSGEQGFQDVYDILTRSSERLLKYLASQIIA